MTTLYPLLRRHWYVVALILGVALFMAHRNATTQSANGDPYIYWAVGGKFLADQPLYEPVPGSQEFLYPPVAVLFCQLMALLPFPMAVGLFTFLNVMAWAGLVWLVYKLLRHYFPAGDLRVPLLIGFLASIRYFWHNISWANVNEITALLAFGGLLTYLKGHRTLGLALLTLGMWIKVLALLLISIFLIRRPVKTAITVLSFSALYTLIVFAFRGVDQGIHDYIDYWEITFRPFLLGGKVFPDWIAFGISPLLTKLLTEHAPINGIVYNVVSWPPALVGKISLVIRLLLVANTSYFIWKSRRRAQVPLTGIILSFLTMLLVSGVAWEGHHLTLLLVVAGLYHLLGQAGAITLQRTVAGLSVLVGMLTSDLIGFRLSDYLQAFSLITYLVMFLYGCATWLAYRPRKYRFVTPQAVPPTNSHGLPACLIGQVGRHGDGC